MTPLQEAALIAARDCLGIKSAESVLIVTDTPTVSIAKALQYVCTDLAGEVMVMEMQSRQLNGQEPPAAIAEAMKHVNVAICATSTSLTHTDARRNACAAGARVGTMPGITEDVMIRCMRADYHKIARLTERVSDILTAGEVATITTPAGTDIRLPIKGYNAKPSTGMVLESGAYGNLPSGEAFLMPREGEAEGIYVVDGSLAGVGLITNEPISITIEKGMAVAIEGGEQARRFNEMVDKAGPQARNLAELGVGTNDQAEIKGTVLEDEKVLGTVHLALGNNVSMGGTVNVGFHVDGILKKPTLKIDGQAILIDGVMQV